MGNLIFYRDHELGNCSKARWRHARRLLPLLVEFVNQSMKVEWVEGQIRSVSVSTDGSVSPSSPPPLLPRPPVSPFALDSFLSDESETDCIYVTDADEMTRLFKWCDFLEQRDGVYAFYRPLVDALRSWRYGIEQFTDDGRAT